MSRISIQPVCLLLSTNDEGTAALSLKVPGTFAGATQEKSGRLIKYFDIWTIGGTEDDRIYDMRIEDTDEILRATGQSGAFPDYPVLYYFQDQDIEEKDELKKGFLLKPAHTLHIERIDQVRDPFDFVPSGMYFKATFSTANETKSGQKLRMNVGWGKNT